jgi:hypothetical protein
MSNPKNPKPTPEAARVNTLLRRVSLRLLEVTQRKPR